MTKEREALKLALEALDSDNPDIQLRAAIVIRGVLAQPEQEPVAHLWECLGRWSAYLANNGMQAECAPPSWLVDAIKKATTPPQRKPLEGVIDVQPIGYHSLQLIFRSQADIAKFKAAHDIKEKNT